MYLQRIPENNPSNYFFIMHDINYDKELDASGLLCPWPLVHAKQMLALLASVQILRVISTDPSSVLDFKVFAAKTQHILLHNYEHAGKYYYFIKKN